MGSKYSFYVWCCFITYFEGVSVDNFMQRIYLGAIFVNKFEKFCSYICLNIAWVGWVKPRHIVTFPGSTGRMEHWDRVVEYFFTRGERWLPPVYWLWDIFMIILGWFDFAFTYWGTYSFFKLVHKILHSNLVLHIGIELSFCWLLLGFLIQGPKIFGIFSSWSFQPLGEILH